MQAGGGIQLHDLVACDGEPWTQSRVLGIGIGNNGVEAVVPALELGK